MGDSDRVLYRERSPWPGWVQLIYWGAMLGAVLPVLLGGAHGDFGGDTGRVMIAAGILGFAAVLYAVMAGLTVSVLRSGVRLGLGNGRLFTRWVGFSEIEDLESVTYRPIAEFGGWGVKGWGKKKAWTARGNQAVVLHLRDDYLLYVGSDRPRRLEERIRSHWEAYRRKAPSEQSPEAGVE